jgi:prepilin-type N-terminal cleavage/methylation domain-containing protein
MRRRYLPDRSARSGFTLVELLVVIAIMAVLISLTTAAVMRARLSALNTQNHHNISQLQTAIQTFCTKMQVDYIPSRIVLRNDLSTYNLADPVESGSLQYLKQLWPRLANNLYSPPNSLGWCPADPAAGLTSRYELEGDQCIVFFLGGIQLRDAASGVVSVQGFSSNKSIPTLLTGKFEPPTMDFPSTRLAYVGTASATRSGTFASFLDPYDSPYLYFSSRSFGRRLRPGDPGYVAGRDAPYATHPGYSRLDCAGLFPGDPTAPLFDSTGKFFNRDGFQIFSAGYDQTFGNNLVLNASQPYNPRTGEPFKAPFHPGHDDLTNFHPTILGAGQ